MIQSPKFDTTVLAVRDMLIADSLRELEDADLKKEQSDGVRDGFEACRLLDSVESFMAAIERSYREEKELFVDDYAPEALERHRCAARIIEYVWSIVRVGLGEGDFMDMEAITLYALYEHRVIERRQSRYKLN